MYYFYYLDRLKKHNKLAPINDFARKLDNKDLKDDGKNKNEINFYDLNDSFIDDGDIVVKLHNIGRRGE